MVEDKLLRLPIPLGVSLLGGSYVILVTVLMLFPETAPAPETSATTVILLGTLLLATGASVPLALVRSPSAPWVWFSLRLVLIEVYLTLTVPEAGLALALVTPLVLEAAQLSRFPRNLLPVLGVIAVDLAIRWANLGLLGGQDPAAVRSVQISAHSRELLPQLGYFLLLTGLAVTAALAVGFRNRADRLEERVEVLTRVAGQLSASNLSFQNLAKDAGEMSSEQERLRITRELHDVIGYTFTSNMMMMEAVLSSMHKDPQRAEGLLDKARENTENGLQKIRSSLYRLRAEHASQTRVQSRILKLCQTFALATQAKVNVDYNNFPDVGDEGVADAFYSFVQQAVTNAFLHGRADQIEVALYASEISLFANVRDNGKGSNSVTEGIGLRGMRERLEPLGGSLRILDTRTGFDILCEIPVDKAKAQA